MSGIISTFRARSSHMTAQSLRDKFSPVGLRDAGEHANYFNVSYMNYYAYQLKRLKERNKIYLKTFSSYF